MRKFAVIAIAVLVTAALTTGGMWAGAQTGTGGTGGTGGTLPEPTPVITPVPPTATPVPPTPTVEPVMVVLGQIQAELILLRLKVDSLDQEIAANRNAIHSGNNMTGLVNEKVGLLLAELETWPSEAEWDTLLTDWSAVTDVATQELLNITDAFALLNARIADQLSNQTGSTVIEVCNGCYRGP